jgi:hypothetical protein
MHAVLKHSAITAKPEACIALVVRVTWKLGNGDSRIISTSNGWMLSISLYTKQFSRSCTRSAPCCVFFKARLEAPKPM